jgi:hypothetical protein
MPKRKLEGAQTEVAGEKHISRWTEEEERKFLLGVELYGGFCSPHKTKVAELIETRSESQTQSNGQKLVVMLTTMYKIARFQSDTSRQEEVRAWRDSMAVCHRRLLPDFLSSDAPSLDKQLMTLLQSVFVDEYCEGELAAYKQRKQAESKDMDLKSVLGILTGLDAAPSDGEDPILDVSPTVRKRLLVALDVQKLLYQVTQRDDSAVYTRRPGLRQGEKTLDETKKSPAHEQKMQTEERCHHKKGYVWQEVLPSNVSVSPATMHVQQSLPHFRILRNPDAFFDPGLLEPVPFAVDDNMLMSQSCS